MTQFTDAQEAMVEDTTVLGEDWNEQDTVGLNSANITQQGFYDDATDAIHEALSEQQGISRVLAYGLEGNEAGKHFTGYAGAMQANYERISSRGELHKANAAYQGAGVVEEGIILHPLGTVTEDGDTEDTGFDGGAQSTDGGAGYLQVTSLDLDGHDDLTVVVRDSADDITYADLVSFTAVTAAPEAERVEVAGTVERYLAVAYSFSGTGTSPSATLMAGFSRH
jgi:hypothetical protein